jgi:putative transcriptional regulator
MTRMAVRHPITDELLMGYAAGLLPEAYDLMVATAVSLDDDARARLSGFEALGGVLMDSIDVPADAVTAAIDPDGFDAVMARINAEPPEQTVPSDTRRARMGGVLPQPLREAVGGEMDDLRWRQAGLGVRQVVLAAPAGEPVARLMRIPAGVAIPDHGHGGVEMTLVLAGSVLDGDMRLRRGDLGIADERVEHTPTAGPGSTCVCFVVTDAPLRFNALIPRIAQRFLDI